MRLRTYALISIVAFATAATAMEVIKFKCKIKWPWSADPSRGNITCLVVSNVKGLDDLSALDGVELDDFWRFNGEVDGDMEDFVKMNKAKTKVLYKRRSSTTPFKRKAWLKLKDGKLYCFYKTTYGKRYAESFGVANVDTDGWMTKEVKIETQANEPGFQGSDIGVFTIAYKTKAGKKSIMKLQSGGGRVRTADDGQGFAAE